MTFVYNSPPRKTPAGRFCRRKSLLAKELQNPAAPAVATPKICASKKKLFPARRLVPSPLAAYNGG